MIEENTFLFDLNTSEHKIPHWKKGRLRLYLGKFENGEFTQTVSTIKELDIDEQNKVRESIRNIWKSYIS